MILAYKDKKPVMGQNVFVAPTAMIIGDVEVQDGASIWYGVVIRGDQANIRIGKNTNIQDNCTVHVDDGLPAIIGDNVSVGHNAVIHGCRIEDECLIAINAVVLSGAIVRSGSVVAAGSVVTAGQEVGPHHLVAGIPAKFKKTLSETPNEIIQKPVRDYHELSKQYREMFG
jgi:carbonic anhydrase/acetyltransferase-like protein (isoleucine patch superfamily)